MAVLLRSDFAMPGPLALPVVARQADQSSVIGTPSGTTTEILVPSSSTEPSTAPAPVPTFSWIDCHTYDRSCDVPNIGVWRCPDNSLVDLSATCPPLIIPWTACHDPPTASNGCKVDPIGVERRWGCADGSSVSEDEKCPEADPSRKVPGPGTPSSSGGGGGGGSTTSPTAGSGDGQRTGGQQGSEGQGGGGQVGQQEPTGQTAGQGASVQATGAGVAATTRSVTFGAPEATSATFRVSTLGTAGTSRSGTAAQSSSAANPADGSYGWRKASTLSAVAIVLFLGLGFAVTV